MTRGAIFLVLFLVTGAQAQHFVYQSASRYIGVMGSAAVLPDGASSNFVQEVSLDVLDPEFHDVVSGEVTVYPPYDANNPYSGGPGDEAVSGGEISQDSTLGANEIDFHSLYTFQTTIPLWGIPPCITTAEGRSWFEVSFTVSSPTHWLVESQMVTPLAGEVLSYEWGLESTGQGWIAGGSGVGIFSEGGMMDPEDTYTFRCELHGQDGLPDPFGNTGIMEMQAALTLVPEPTSFTLLSIGSLAVLLARRRR